MQWKMEARQTILYIEESNAYNNKTKYVLCLAKRHFQENGSSTVIFKSQMFYFRSPLLWIKYETTTSKQQFPSFGVEL